MIEDIVLNKDARSGRDVFASIRRMNNLELMECKTKAPSARIAVWICYSRHNETTHQELTCHDQNGDRRKGTRACC